MKFTGITMKNFMRYKGTNRMTFSCDPGKNVTVVLGDNTVGKTTIAQAFRWGLYEAVFAEKGKKQEDYQLLNNDVLAMMDADSHASVMVEIMAEDDEKRYAICREVSYARIFPRMAVREVYKKVKLEISEREHPEHLVSVAPEKIEEVIHEMFPRNLSHYFLFDGERWNDVTVNGVREDIRESVHILTGLSAYQKAIWHLKDMGSNSVIKKFKGKISGTGNMYDNLNKEQKRMEREITQCKEQIETIDINIRNDMERMEEIEQYLEENRNTEALQAQYRNLCIVRRTQGERSAATYKNLVNEYSDRAFMLFAAPLMEASLKMVKSVAAERRDIPHMHQASIDYIIKTGICICGTPLSEHSSALKCLREQRNYLPPADIGSLLGEFERTNERWRKRSAEAYEELQEGAVQVDAGIREYEETCNRIAALERQMEEHIDFAQKRERIRYYKQEMETFSRQKGELLGQIKSCSRQLAAIEAEMKSQEAKSEENKRWRVRAEIAEALYERLKQDFAAKEQKTFQELNAEIQKNFTRMFNAKDKKIQLTDRYEIQMLYQTPLGYREEKNLSEGEKIARNFAFIVTIMDYSRRKKAEKNGEDEGDTLPLVLDGPFSKLGDENIRLIADVLPRVSEQVIIFMLDKDWKYTGLSTHVGAAYCIEKAAEASFASIREMDLKECALKQKG